MPLGVGAHLSGRLDCLLIDNFDSFTWNLYQQISLLGVHVTVIRNNAVAVSQIPQLKINSLVISPGPGHPKTDSGISRDAISYFAGRVPILGVCMGLECIVDAYGGDIGYAGEIRHGKLSRIRHDGRGCLRGVPQGIQTTRYHSLSASPSSLPADLMVTSATEESGVIMGVRHRKYTIEGVQYHPESIFSEKGDDILRNFLALRGGTWDLNPQSFVLDTSLPPFPVEALGTPIPSKIPSVLENICAQRFRDIESAKSTPGTTPADIETCLSLHLAPPVTSLARRLRAQTPALMAEIKRASPSKGPIALAANAPQLALTYATSGAAVISVLTEPTWFKGSLLDMYLVRQAIDSLPNRPAILRKDFILEEYQIAEARLFGADAVLLIVAMLRLARLKALYTYCLSLGMTPLVEVNNAQEMKQALELGAKVIGINNRNLHDFQVDMGTTSRLAGMVDGQDVVLCALSGITAVNDVKTYSEQGVSAFLIGEALMKAKDTPAFIRSLLAKPEPKPKHKSSPLVKICGIRTEQEAIFAAEAGADMLGLMFVPSSKRLISIDTARRITSAAHSWRSTKALPLCEESSEVLVDQTWFRNHANRLHTSPRPLIVGVFQNQPLEDVLDIVAACHLDLVQLHGHEPLEWSRLIPVPVIRAFHVDGSGQGLGSITKPGYHQFILLDTIRDDGLSGGSGQIADRNMARRVVDGGEFPICSSAARVTSTLMFPNGTSAPLVLDRGHDAASRPCLPILLAGGLTPENVASVVTEVGPWAVDVCSGVETTDGKAKDLEKVAAFIVEAKK